MEKSFGFEPIEGVSDYHYVICSPYDADRMKEIIRGLKIYGLPIWYDKGMLADDQRKKIINERIRLCTNVIIIITRTVFEKNDPWIRIEYSLAKKYKKRLFVLFFDNVYNVKSHSANQSFYNELMERQGIILYNIDSPNITEKNDKIIKEVLSKIDQSNINSIKTKISIAFIFILIFISVFFLYPSVPNTITYEYSTNSITGINIQINDRSRENDEFSLVIPEKIGGKEITKIDAFAFAGYQNLTSVTIPDSVTSIGDYAFLGCTRLEKVVLPDHLKYLGRGAFRNCEYLAQINLPDSITVINDFTFENTRLYEVNIPYSVTEIGASAFANTIIEEVNIPDSVTKIGTSAFFNCTNLSKVTMSNSLVTLDRSAFMDCWKIHDIVLPNSLSIIDYDVFSGCINLNQVVLPDYINVIRTGAFFRCKSLTLIEIPDYLTYIDDAAFDIDHNITFIGSAGCYSEQFANEHEFIDFKYR